LVDDAGLAVDPHTLPQAFDSSINTPGFGGLRKKQELMSARGRQQILLVYAWYDSMAGKDFYVIEAGAAVARLQSVG
jgi:hypothetical protein